MAFFKSLPDGAGVPEIYGRYPEIYRPWVAMGEALMQGPSPLTSGERELLAAFVSGLNRCEFCFGIHAELAYARGVPEGLIEKILSDVDQASVETKLKPLLKFVRKLTLTPARMTQADAAAVFTAGWEEQALHDAIAVCGRMSFMNRLMDGHGIPPMDRETARAKAKASVAAGGYHQAMLKRAGAKEG